jgi:hypothetical protein
MRGLLEMFHVEGIRGNHRSWTRLGIRPAARRPRRLSSVCVARGWHVRCRVARVPLLPLKGSIVIDDPHSEDIRGLFDWRSAVARVEQPGGTASAGVENDDLALALQLLSCNSRDREQFGGRRAGAASAA